MMGGTAVVYDSHELWADRNLRPEPRWWLLVCESLFVRVRTPDDHRQPRLLRGDGPALPDPAAAGGAKHPGCRPERCERRWRRRAVAGWSSGAARLRSSLYVGALTSGRGLEVAIRAMALSEGARLRLVGPVRDRYRAELTELARREGVADRVEFAGAVAPERVLETVERGRRGAGADPARLPLLPDEPPQQAVRVRGRGRSRCWAATCPRSAALVREHGIGLVAQPDRCGRRSPRS